MLYRLISIHLGSKNFEGFAVNFHIKKEMENPISFTYLCIYFSCICYFLLNDLNMRLRINTKMIAPMIAGIREKPATSGPQCPSISVPNHEPTSPAIILPIIPPGILRPAMIPPIQPIIPPMISIQIKPML